MIVPTSSMTATCQPGQLLQHLTSNHVAAEYSNQRADYAQEHAFDTQPDH